MQGVGLRQGACSSTAASVAPLPHSQCGIRQDPASLQLPAECCKRPLALVYAPPTQTTPYPHLISLKQLLSTLPSHPSSCSLVARPCAAQATALPLA